MNRRLLWLIPPAIFVVLLAIILALPGFVAARAHRATIEALASSLTGRDVHIDGGLSLAFIPAPELIAEKVRIGGPAQETITARSLTLDIALPALLRGRLAASSLTLQSPVIAFPWPLPGGPRAVAPPALLAALHARMTGGTITMGEVSFRNVNADIFTGGNGTVTISGNGTYAGENLAVSISLAASDAAGSAAMSIDAATIAAPDSTTPVPQASCHIDGTLDGKGAVAGRLTLSATLPGLAAQITGAARLASDATHLTATAMALQSGSARLAGSVTLTLPHPYLDLDLTGAGIDLSALPRPSGMAAPIGGHIKLRLANAGLAGQVIPQILAAAAFSPAGLAVEQLAVTLPANGAATAAGAIDPQGGVTGRVTFDAPDMPALLAAFAARQSWPLAWRHTHVDFDLAGASPRFALKNLTGSLGADDFTGGLVLTDAPTGALTAPQAAGQLNFKQLDLAPAASLIHGFGTIGAASLSGELTAARASFGRLTMTRLLLDAALSNQLVVRRLSAALDGGLVDTSFTLAPSGGLTAARGLLTVPAADGLLALLPAAWQPPDALARAPLSVSVLAEGPPQALATSIAATLGPVSLTAAPVVNITDQTAAGPLTLRHPDAIAAFAAFGQKSGLAWPGAGSVALRADMVYSAAQFGLPDFVLSAGDLTADGRIIIKPGPVIDAQIDADTLALPPLSQFAPLPWPVLAAAQGRIDMSANRVWLGGQEVFGAGTARMDLTPGGATMTIPKIALAGGALAGVLTAKSPAAPAGPPAFTATLQITGVNAAALPLTAGLPYAIPAGILDGGAALTATGYGPAAWTATLAGNASLTGTNGSLSGFDLAALRAALQAPGPAKTARIGALRSAATSGNSAFSKLGIAGHFDHGSFSLDQAVLTGPDGAATAAGSIDLPDGDLALDLLLSPAVTPPLALNVTTLGSWAAPKQIPTLREALAWMPAPESPPQKTP